jgi:hypothetical protein
MLSRFFGKSDKVDDSPSKESQAKRGVDATEEAPDTAWREWDSALTAQNAIKPAPTTPTTVIPQPAVAAPSLPAAAPQSQTVDFELATMPMPFEAPTLDQRKDRALNTVEKYHQRIANTIRTLWGYKECGVYINKLIMSGGDGMGQARVGFSQEAVQAMLELSDLHDAAFGPPDMPGGGMGFSI